MTVSQPADIDLRTVATVSQSEAGFEEIPQSLACLFSWPLRLAPGDGFEVDLRLSCTVGAEPSSA